MIAVRYDFKFVDDSLLNDYDLIKKEILGHRKPTARLVGGEVVINDATESLKEFWNANLKNKSPLLQIDSLKNFGIKTNGIKIPANSQLAYKVAHNNNNNMFEKDVRNQMRNMKKLCQIKDRCGLRSH